KPGVPAPRPVAGPIIPLTGASSAPEDLASGPAPASSDPTATRVLVRGDPAPAPNGRADDFAWPRPDVDDASIIPAAVVPTAAPTPQRPAGKKGAPPAAEKEKAAAKRGGQAASTSPPARQAR